MSARRFLALVLPAAIVGVTGVPAAARAQCTYPLLTSGSPVYYSAGTVLYPSFVQSTNYWSAVAIRPDPGTDWDLALYQSTTSYPACVANQLASSTLGGSAVDVIVGDFNHNPFGSYVVRPYVYSGTGNARIEWDDGPDQFQVNAPRIQRSSGPNDVIECWDVFLEAGRNYDVECRTLGDNNMKLLLFQNPAAAPYWVNRSSRNYELNFPPGSATIAGLVVDQSDWYGLVMINENGVAGDYQLQIESCVSPPVPLASTVQVTASEPARRYSFHQSQAAFAVIGVRPDQASNYWSMWVGESIADLAPQCYSTHRASSIAADAVAYVVGDFNAGSNPTNATYYARASAPWGTGSSTGTVEWDDGPERIVVGDPPISASTGPGDVVRCWDVPLEAGYRYRVSFTHGGPAKQKLALFDNPGGVFWAPRSEARVESDTTFYVDVTRTDWYALVLANDNGGAGNYQIGIERCTTPIVLAGDTPYLNIASTTNARFDLTVANPTWAALGVRCTEPAQDWNLTLFADRFGLTPHCFSNARATSQLGSGVVDVIAGRPNLGGGGSSFYADPSPGLATSANGIFEWEQGVDELTIGAPPITHPIAFDDVVHAWDLTLAAGTTYTFTFEREGAVNAKLLLFGASGLLYEGAWKSRSEAEFSTNGNISYTATSSGPHGVIVVHDDDGIGAVRIGVYQGVVAVDPAPPIRTQLEGIHPNPAAAGSRIRFALAQRSSVGFEVVNAAGRRVSVFDAGTREPGHWGVDWDGIGSNGRRLGAGVYFVRMRVDGAAVQDTRLVLLP